MKKTTKTAARKTAARKMPEFEQGQVWKMGEDQVQIRLVGKRLVHYKHFRGANKRPPTLFTAKDELGRLLFQNKAVLAQ
jgi:hypothetical protein